MVASFSSSCGEGREVTKGPAIAGGSTVDTGGVTDDIFDKSKHFDLTDKSEPLPGTGTKLLILSPPMI